MKKPIRMCLSCRERNTQDSMLRLQQDTNQVIKYRGYGRSFYICCSCIDDEKKIKKIAKRLKQNEERFAELLKESI